MTTGDGVGHELGWLRASLESLSQQLDRHIHLEAERARFASATLREILQETKSTNGRVSRLEEWRDSAAAQVAAAANELATAAAAIAQLNAWREQREPVIASVRREELDAAAVQRWWQTMRGRVGIAAGVLVAVIGGALQVAAGVKALFG